MICKSGNWLIGRRPTFLKFLTYFYHGHNHEGKGNHLIKILILLLGVINRSHKGDKEISISILVYKKNFDLIPLG